jgi:hypothetical protein
MWHGTGPIPFRAIANYGEEEARYENIKSRRGSIAE